MRWHRIRPMRARIHSARLLGLGLAAAALSLGVAACGQSGPVHEGPTDEGAGGSAGVNPEGNTGIAAAPTPGPGATPGCDALTGPVFELVELSTSGNGPVDSAGRTDDVAAASEDVARASGGVDDNALSAVSSRLSGLAVQPEVSDDAVRAQWDQFRQLCDID